MSDTFNTSSILKIAFETLSRAIFKKTNTEEIAVRVSPQDTGDILEGVSFDDIQVSYPSDSVEHYAYYLNGVLQTTLEVTYEDFCKKVLTRVRKI